MNILIVGNILKDVYLNLDPRTESFETDRTGTRWLDFGFNGSEHHYFSRNSSFGGAAVSLEVLTKLGLSTSIAGSDFTISKDAPAPLTPADSYRYILTSDDGVSYLVGSHPKETTFIPPVTAPDYLYLDRSAAVTMDTADAIRAYLEANMGTALILYLKDLKNPALNSLIPSANLIFTELTPDFSEEIQALESDHVVYLSEKKLQFKRVTQAIHLERIDKMTHLSIYSIAAATILGGFILGHTVEESLRFAAANLENSTLDSVLSLKDLQILSAASPESLELIAATLMTPGKGILAADESGGSIAKKFAELDIPDTPENRHFYRNIFFTTPGIEDYLSGVILFDETAHDHMNTGQAIPDFLISKRIIPGVKVDHGLERYENSPVYNSLDGPDLPYPEETFTKGLSGLGQRLKEYYEMGLRFAKWRAAFHISLSENGKILTPTPSAVADNCRILAEYALACQNAGLVPIVEPEILYDGDHSITKCAEVTGTVLDALITALIDTNVNLRATIIKTSMVLSGKKYEVPSSPEEVGRATAEVLLRHIPPEIAGVVFLSGGQTAERSMANLAAITHASTSFPWPVSFSFSRALGGPVLEAWHGDADNLDYARATFTRQLEQAVAALK